MSLKVDDISTMRQVLESTPDLDTSRKILQEMDMFLTMAKAQNKIAHHHKTLIQMNTISKQVQPMI